jgi:hypothetical protein
MEYKPYVYIYLFRIKLSTMEIPRICCKNKKSSIRPYIYGIWIWLALQTLYICVWVWPTLLIYQANDADPTAA